MFSTSNPFIFLAFVTVLTGIELGLRCLDQQRWQWTLGGMIKLTTGIGTALGILRVISPWL